MTIWLWVNLALGALFVLAIVGVPLWLVITRPDTGPDTTAPAWRHVHVLERPRLAGGPGPRGRLLLLTERGLLVRGRSQA